MWPFKHFWNVTKCGNNLLEHLLLANCQEGYLQIYPMLIPFCSKNLAASKTSTTLWPRVFSEKNIEKPPIAPLVRLCSAPGTLVMLPFIPTISTLGPESSVEYQDLLAPAVEPEILTWFFSTPETNETNDFCASILFGCKAFPSHARFDAKQENMVFTLYMYSRYIRCTF